MTQNNRTKSKNLRPEISSYVNWVHGFGRLGLVLVVIYMIAIPTIVCAVYNCFPPIENVIQGGLGVWAMFVPLTISECISYTPMIGSSAYLAFLTGNVVNIKLPAALNAIKLAKTEPNTEESDAIATVAVAVSSILTIVIIAIGVLLFIPLQPLLSLPEVKTATAYMLPALFGGLFVGLLGKESGKQFIQKKLLILVVPTIIIFALALFGILSSGMEGIAILVMLPVTILCAWLLFKKGIVKVVAKAETHSTKEQ